MIWLLRHIETSFNTNGLIVGQTDVGVNSIAGQHIKFPSVFMHETVKIYTSTLSRCILTTKILSDDIYTNTKARPIIEYSDNLKERNMGVWEGRKKEDIIKNNSDKFIDGHFNPNLTPPKGEDLEKFITRAEWLKSHIAKDHQQNIVICSHNQFLKLFFHIMKGDYKLKQWTNIGFKHGVIVPVYEIA